MSFYFLLSLSLRDLGRSSKEEVIIMRAKRANEESERSEWNGRKFWQKKTRLSV
jgi:hypothetical protein